MWELFSPQRHPYTTHVEEILLYRITFCVSRANYIQSIYISKVCPHKTWFPNFSELCRERIGWDWTIFKEEENWFSFIFISLCRMFYPHHWNKTSCGPLWAITHKYCGLAQIDQLHMLFLDTSCCLLMRGSCTADASYLLIMIRLTESVQ